MVAQTDAESTTHPTSTPPSRNVSRAVRVLTSLPARIFITVGLLALLAVTIDWSPVADRVASGNPAWFAAAVALLVTALLIAARRWLVLLNAAAIKTTWPAARRAYLIGTFANNFLPSGFGGDAVRAVLAAGPDGKLSRAAASVLFDRLSALACLVLLAWLALPSDLDQVPDSLVYALAVVTAAGIAAVVLARAVMRSERAARLVPERLRPSATDVVDALATFNDRRVLIEVGLLGILYQGVLVGAAWAGARAIDLELSYALLAVAVALVLLLTLVPISIAGFGVREGGFVIVLGTAGVAAADATLLSLVAVVLMALASLPGAIGLISWRRSAVALSAAGQSASSPTNLR
jgi:glycosyltransferase 2 family protein